MLRLRSTLLRRVSYVTDVEGDLAYFQRFVCLSRVLKWEESTSTGGRGDGMGSAGESPAWTPLRTPLVPKAMAPPPPSAFPPASQQHSTSGLGVVGSSSGGGLHPSSTPAASSSEYGDDSYNHLVDLTRFRLAFRDATSHFVFGGDAFDQGADITFCSALLDFKRRFPQRVHLILGNRDVCKMVLYPRMALEVAGMSPDEAEDTFFVLPPLPTAAAKQVAMTPQLRYRDYLKQQQCPSPRRAADKEKEEAEEVVADPVTFLQWTLRHKLGSPNAFDHRRRELQELRSLGTQTASPASLPPISDAEVAASFFAAAQPGGVYYEYLRLGVLSVVLDGVLFVHGGVNGMNAGFVPSLAATSYAEQLTAGEWWLPEVRPQLEEEEEVEGLSQSNSVGEATAAPAALPSHRRSAREWLDALAEFKEAAFAEWVSNTGLRGDALRAYVYPRFVAPHSVAVGTVMHLDGPRHISLPAAAFLIESGIHTVCGGHQPIGDTPAVVRQPGGFMIVDADTSYCGRGNAFCTKYNKRGAAVMELLLDSGDTTTETAAAGGEGEEGNTQQPHEPLSSVPSLVAHGYRADGTPFKFDLYDDARVGRHVGDGWWVRLPPGVSSDHHADLYELRRTRDGFRHEEVRTATAQEVDAWLRQAAASGQAMVQGYLAQRYTKAELAEVRVHRLKTKVTRS